VAEAALLELAQAALLDLALERAADALRRVALADGQDLVGALAVLRDAADAAVGVVRLALGVGEGGGRREGEYQDGEQRRSHAVCNEPAG
jgi:hypothetical protein